MKTPFKIFLGLILILLVAVIAVTIAVTLVFKPDDYRRLVVDAIEQNTGRSFDLHGDLGLKVLPCCSISLGTSTLGNPSGFPAGYFAKVDAAALSLKIWPLLIRGEVQIGSVTLEGLDLALLRLADGRASWDFADSSSAEATDASDTALDGLTIAGLNIRDAHLSYRDEATAAAYSASKLQLETGTIDRDLSFDIRTTMTVTDETTATAADLTLSSTISLSGNELIASGLAATVAVANLAPLNADVEARARATELALDIEAMSGAVTALELDLEGLGVQIKLSGSGTFGTAGAEMRGSYEVPSASLRTLAATVSDETYRPPDSAALTSLSGTGSWILQQQSLRFEDINLLLDDTRLTGSAGIDDFETTASKFELQADHIDLDRYLVSSSAEDAAKEPAAPTSIPLAALQDTNLDGRLFVEQLRASQTDFANLALTLSSNGREAAVALSGRGLGGSFSLEGRGDVTAAQPYLRGGVTLVALSPRILLSALGESPNTADPDVLSRLSGQTRWQLGPNSLALEQLAIQLDQTHVSGNLRVDDFDRPATRFELALDRLNLDAYLEPDDETSAGPAAEIPVEVIRDLNATGRLLAQELTVAKVKLLNLVANVAAVDGVVRIAPLQASVFGGDYRGNVTIDATGRTAKLSFDQQVSAIQVGDLLRVFYDTDRLAGSLSMQLTGSGIGNTQAELLKAISGDFSLNLNEGVYRGMDVLYEVNRARSLLRNEPLPAAPASKETPIRALSMSGKMLNGVLRSDALKAETAFMRLVGKGGVNLVEQSLDYELNAQVLRKPEVAAGENLADLVNIDIPLTIRGAMTAPKVGVDLKRFATTTVRDKVQERARDALLERLGAGKKDKSSPAEETPTAPADQSEAQPPQPAVAAEDQAQPDAPEQPQQAVEAEPEPIEPEEQEQPEAESPKELLKRGLRDLLKPTN